jgi:hypothetical protein
MNGRPHVVPIDDLLTHETSETCRCNPAYLEDGRLVIHHSFDGREHRERQGVIDSKKRWEIIEEYENTSFMS